jgi:hypothetical protein
MFAIPPPAPPKVEVATHCTVDPFDWRMYVLMPAEPVLSKSLPEMVRFEVEALVAVSDGVESAPVLAMVVVPLTPAAKVLAERLVVEAFWKIAVPVKVGLFENTRFPVPVSSESRADSSIEVSTEEVPSAVLLRVFPVKERRVPGMIAFCFELNADQSADVRRPRADALADGSVNV